jgi:hypothetical protein
MKKNKFKDLGEQIPAYCYAIGAQTPRTATKQVCLRRRFKHSKGVESYWRLLRS